MPLYIVKAPVKHGGKLRRDGEIELSAEQAAPMLKSGFLAEHDASATESGKGKAPAAGSSAAGAEPGAAAGSGAKVPAQIQPSAESADGLSGANGGEAGSPASPPAADSRPKAQAKTAKRKSPPPGGKAKRKAA